MPSAMQVFTFFFLRAVNDTLLQNGTDKYTSTFSMAKQIAGENDKAVIHYYK